MVVTQEEGFSVNWQDPADAALTWMYDPMHFPKPLTPIAGEFLRRMYQEFMNARTMIVNGYAFSTVPTPRPPSPEIVERGVVDVWTNDFLPRIREFCQRARTADYESMSLAKLGKAVQDIVNEAIQTFGLTMQVITGFMGPTFGLVQLLEHELGREGPREAATLLQGFENGTAAAGAGLSDLAEEASKRPAVAEALRRGQYGSLESVAGGKEFLARLREYLDEFGWRANTWSEVNLPTWAEDPRTPLMLVGRYLADPDRSPATAIRRAARQRDEAVREVEAKLAADKLPHFRALLSAAQAHVPMSEDRALWQLIIIGSVRVPLLALGRRLVEAGAFAAADDVFYMTTDELARAAEGPASVKETVAERRAQLEHAARMAPPPFLGAPPDPSKAPPEMQALVRLFFGGAPPEVDGRRIKGQAASKGVVRGTARVIHSLNEADRLQAGEILVCTTTAPPWTPLFAIAAGVVTDSGGVLSHSAICAREYAIPCVVATQIATKIIPDGATITVDGTNGVVTIEG